MLYGLEMIVNTIGDHVDGEDAIAVIADGSVLGILDLPEDDDGADDEDHGDGELQYGEDPARDRCGGTGLEDALQHFDGPEGREIECGVTTGDEPGEQGEAEAAHPEDGIGPGDGHFLAGDAVEEGHEQAGQQECGGKGYDGNEQ